LGLRQARSSRSPDLAHVDRLKTDYRGRRTGFESEVAVCGVGEERVRHPRMRVLPALLPFRQGISSELNRLPAGLPVKVVVE
jgi:hypothetical protein